MENDRTKISKIFSLSTPTSDNSTHKKKKKKSNFWEIFFSYRTKRELEISKMIFFAIKKKKFKKKKKIKYHQQRVFFITWRFSRATYQFEMFFCEKSQNQQKIFTEIWVGGDFN